MKPSIHRALVEFTDAGRRFALATVLEASGSTPRKAGAKALIDSDGAIHGTIGGGAVEAEAQRRAIDAIRSGVPLVFDFALEGSIEGGEHGRPEANPAGSAQPICGGSMRILIDPTAGDHRPAYSQANQTLRGRQSGVLLTTVAALRGALPRVVVRWLPADSIMEGSLDDLGFPGSQAVRSALVDQSPRLAVEEHPEPGRRLEVFLEPLTPAPLLVIAGGGHIGQALALQANLVGFDIVVIDDRREFVDPALYPPGVATRCGDIAGEIAGLPQAEDTYVVIVTRGHQHDQAALAACLTRKCNQGNTAAYVGMIGSRRKVALIRNELLRTGAATAEQLDRVYAPIGLDIGAQTVPEIAASIVAQLIAVRRKGDSPRFPGRPAK